MNAYFTILAIENIAICVLLFMFIVFWVAVIMINNHKGDN